MTTPGPEHVAGLELALSIAKKRHERAGLAVDAARQAVEAAESIEEGVAEILYTIERELNEARREAEAKP